MRLKPDQLAAQLDNKGLAQVYLVSGDEPLQLLECADLIRQRARQEGTEERIVMDVVRGFDWDSLSEASANMSLFASRRLIELHLGTQKPGRDGGKAMLDFAGQHQDDTTLLITAAKLDRQTQQSKWYKGLDAAGVTIQVWPVRPAELPGWITSRAQRLGKRINMDAARLIAQNVEGNLLAARQEIEKLCLLVEGRDIDVRQAMEAVNDSSRYDVFNLIETAFNGNLESSTRMLRGLKSEGVEPLGVFGALMWEFRRICSMAAAMRTGKSRQTVISEFRVWDSRKPAVNRVLERLDAQQLASLLAQAHAIDRVLKGADRFDPWETMERFLLQLAGQAI